MKANRARLAILFLTAVVGATNVWAQATPATDPPSPQAAPAPAAAPAAPAPLPTPAVTGPLSNLPPLIVDAGPLGKISVNGVVSGFGQFQSNSVPGDSAAHGALANGQIFIQKTDGWFQFYLQAGAYNIPALGAPFVSTERTMNGLFGPVPIGFVKLQAGKNTSILVGALPTLIGAEYSFTFENMNVERGLLWYQENLVNRGIQVNQTMGKFSASVSVNDGFYSDRYSWVSGSLAYASGPHAISFVAGGNLGETRFTSFSTPIQNNGSIYNVIYTFTKGSWIIQPYYQHTSVPTNTDLGIVEGSSTNGGAILASYALKHGFSIPARFEYIASSGGPNAVNLIYGPGSSGTSFTVTPTYQSGGFYARGDLAVVHAGNYTPGYVFGPNGTDNNQFRAAIEVGFIFGNNIVDKKP